MGRQLLIASGGTRVECWTPTNTRAGVVLVSEWGGIDGVVEDYAQRLVVEGYQVACPDLWWRTGLPPGAGVPEDVESAVATLADHEALADVAAARALLTVGRPTFVMGFGVGGLYARMAGCALLGLAGVVEFYGRVVYGVISPNKGVQPLDLLLGLSCPIQCHFGTRDRVAPEAHVDELERRLLGRKNAAQVLRYAGCGQGFMNPRSAAGDERQARLAWARALTFLEQVGGAADSPPPVS